MCIGALTISQKIAFSQTNQDILIIQRVIQSQIKAMAGDDWGEAFQYASLEIKRSLGNSGSFKKMVLEKYNIVYRPRVVSFKNTELFHGSPAQGVYMVGSNGKAAMVIYFMIKDENNEWRINGVQLFPAKKLDT
jgi:predicted AAA+ superfamily ATPase